MTDFFKLAIKYTCTYLTLQRDFIDRKVSGKNFESQYLEIRRFLLNYQSDNEVEMEFIACLLELVEQIFVSVDAFCSDNTLADEDDLDEAELRRIVTHNHELILSTSITTIK